MEIITFSFSEKGDERGSLVAIEGGSTIPFAIQRVYYVYGTQPGIVRGHHAHLSLEQVLICISGSCTIVLDDGIDRSEVTLSSPAAGLYIGAFMWHEMKDFSEGAVLLVLASDHYLEADYIRDYSTFLRQVKSRSNRG
jgi:dTDP-4-dehydrorhamnose 3,5-epimerase-like enzyme